MTSTEPSERIENTRNSAHTPGSLEVLLTVEDVAGMLRVSTAWVRDHCERKRPLLPALKVGKLWRFRYTDIMAWIQEQEQERARQMKLAC